MSNINDRFWNELFVKKEVHFNQEQYRILFKKIWKNERLFKDLLTSNSETIQKQASKDISDLFSFSINCSFPDFYFPSLISSEQIVQSDSATKKKREHSVHSIMIYILGIWLFFNHPTFNKSIIDQESKEITISNGLEKPILLSINNFIDSWIMFSLFHDIGYIFEDNIDIKGKCSNEAYTKFIRQFNEIDENVYYNRIIEYITNLIIIFNTLLKSTSSLKEKNYNLLKESDFINYSTNKNIKICNEINDSIFDSYYLLYNISCYEEIVDFLPFISEEKIITVIKDNNLEIIAIKQGKNKIFVSESINQLSTVELNNIDILCSETFNNGRFKTEYYIETPHKVLDDYFIKTSYYSFYKDNFLKPAKLIGDLFFSDFVCSDCYNDYEQIKYRIFSYLKQNIPLNTLNKSQSVYKKEQSDAYKEILIDYLNSELKRIKLNNTDNYAKTIWTYAKGILESEEMQKQYIVEIMQKSQNKNEIPILDHFISMIYANFKKYKSVDFIKTRDCDGGKIIYYDLFDLSRQRTYDTQTKSLYNLIKNRIIYEWSKLSSGKNEQDFNKLLTYHYKSKYDHGIMSSSILMQTFLSNIKINNSFAMQERTGSEQILNILSNKNHMLINNKCVFERTIFAILFHNIFVSSYEKMFNESYKQTLTTNAFSYFAAFCDNLQTWDRPEVFDYMFNDISSNYVIGNNIDIDIKGNRIIVAFNSNSIKNRLYKYKESLNDYLDGASSFVELFFFDN